ncbi:hypothetical protein DIPPA_02162 [Diplonema papillatum]|nr:hypothetical protein DIPPA_02162 [Diplonema papillatum]
MSQDSDTCGMPDLVDEELGFAGMMNSLEDMLHDEEFAPAAAAPNHVARVPKKFDEAASWPKVVQYPTPKNRPCKYWESSRTCRFGNRCAFTHNTYPAAAPAPKFVAAEPAEKLHADDSGSRLLGMYAQQPRMTFVDTSAARPAAYGDTSASLLAQQQQQHRHQQQQQQQQQQQAIQQLFLSQQPAAQPTYWIPVTTGGTTRF